MLSKAKEKLKNRFGTKPHHVSYLTLGLSAVSTCMPYIDLATDAFIIWDYIIKGLFWHAMLTGGLVLGTQIIMTVYFLLREKVWTKSALLSFCQVKEPILRIRTVLQHGLKCRKAETEAKLAHQIFHFNKMKEEVEKTKFLLLWETMLENVPQSCLQTTVLLSNINSYPLQTFIVQILKVIYGCFRIAASIHFVYTTYLRDKGFVVTWPYNFCNIVRNCCLLFSRMLVVAMLAYTSPIALAVGMAAHFIIYTLYFFQSNENSNNFINVLRAGVSGQSSFFLYHEGLVNGSLQRNNIYFLIFALENIAGMAFVATENIDNFTYRISITLLTIGSSILGLGIHFACVFILYPPLRALSISITFYQPWVTFHGNEALDILHDLQEAEIPIGEIMYITLKKNFFQIVTKNANAELELIANLLKMKIFISESITLTCTYNSRTANITVSISQVGEPVSPIEIIKAMEMSNPIFQGAFRELKKYSFRSTGFDYHQLSFFVNETVKLKIISNNFKILNCPWFVSVEFASKPTKRSFKRKIIEKLHQTSLRYRFKRIPFVLNPVFYREQIVQKTIANYSNTKKIENPADEKFNDFWLSVQFTAETEHPTLEHELSLLRLISDHRHEFAPKNYLLQSYRTVDTIFVTTGSLENRNLLQVKLPKWGLWNGLPITTTKIEYQKRPVYVVTFTIVDDESFTSENLIDYLFGPEYDLQIMQERWENGRIILSFNYNDVIVPHNVRLQGLTKHEVTISRQFYNTEDKITSHASLHWIQFNKITVGQIVQYIERDIDTSKVSNKSYHISSETFTLHSHCCHECHTHDSHSKPSSSTNGSEKEDSRISEDLGTIALQMMNDIDSYFLGEFDETDYDLIIVARISNLCNMKYVIDIFQHTFDGILQVVIKKDSLVFVAANTAVLNNLLTLVPGWSLVINEEVTITHLKNKGMVNVMLTVPAKFGSRNNVGNFIETIREENLDLKIDKWLLITSNHNITSDVYGFVLNYNCLKLLTLHNNRLTWHGLVLESTILDGVVDLLKVPSKDLEITVYRSDGRQITQGQAQNLKVFTTNNNINVDCDSLLEFGVLKIYPSLQIDRDQLMCTLPVWQFGENLNVTILLDCFRPFINATIVVPNKEKLSSYCLLSKIGALDPLQYVVVRHIQKEVCDILELYIDNKNKKMVGISLPEQKINTSLFTPMQKQLVLQIRGLEMIAYKESDFLIKIKEAYDLQQEMSIATLYLKMDDEFYLICRNINDVSWVLNNVPNLDIFADYIISIEVPVEEDSINALLLVSKEVKSLKPNEMFDAVLSENPALGFEKWVWVGYTRFIKCDIYSFIVEEKTLNNNNNECYIENQRLTIIIKNKQMTRPTDPTCDLQLCYVDGNDFIKNIYEAMATLTGLYHIPEFIYQYIKIIKVKHKGCLIQCQEKPLADIFLHWFSTSNADCFSQCIIAQKHNYDTANVEIVDYYFNGDIPAVLFSNLGDKYPVLHCHAWDLVYCERNVRKRVFGLRVHPQALQSLIEYKTIELDNFKLKVKVEKTYRQQFHEFYTKFKAKCFNTLQTNEFEAIPVKDECSLENARFGYKSNRNGRQGSEGRLSKSNKKHINALSSQYTAMAEINAFLSRQKDHIGVDFTQVDFRINALEPEDGYLVTKADIHSSV